MVLAIERAVVLLANIDRSTATHGYRREHRQRLRTIRLYEYEDAATLLADFWKEVDQVLRERGSIP